MDRPNLNTGGRRVHREMPRVTDNYPAWAILLGAAVTAAGAWLAFAAATGIISGNRTAAYAGSAVFMIPGLMLTAKAWSGWRRRQALATVPPSEKWRYAADWDAAGTADGSMARALGALAVSLALAAIVAAFHIVFLSVEGDGGPWLVYVVLGLFDVVVLMSVGYSLYLLLIPYKYGQARVLFSEFPYRPGRRWDFTLKGGSRLANRKALQAELLCLKEYYEQHGSGDQATMHHVHEVVFEQAAEFSTDPEGLGSLSFEVPAGVPGTDLTALPPTYWELAVRSTGPGVDYEGIFFLPVEGR